MGINKNAAENDSNPANLVLGTYDQIKRYTGKIKPSIEIYKSLNFRGRANLLSNAAGYETEKLNIPPPALKLQSGNYAGGKFRSNTWTIIFGIEIFKGNSKDEIAFATAAMLHEYEHLAEGYFAARYLAVKSSTMDKKSLKKEIINKLNLKPEIAEKASNNPIDVKNQNSVSLGKACLFRRTAESLTKEQIKKNKAKNYPPDSPWGKSVYHANRAQLKKVRKQLKEWDNNLDTDPDLYFKLRNEERQREVLYRYSSPEIGATLITNLILSAMKR